MIQYIEARTQQCESPENEGDGIKMGNSKRRDEEQADDGGRCEVRQAPRGFELAAPDAPDECCAPDPSFADRSALFRRRMPGQALS